MSRSGRLIIVNDLHLKTISFCSEEFPHTGPSHDDKTAKNRIYVGGKGMEEGVFSYYLGTWCRQLAAWCVGKSVVFAASVRILLNVF